MTKTDDLVELARKVGQIALERGWHLATVESCTGGWVAKTITSVPGSSLWFECALVTYSNESKNALAGVPMELIDTHGAVSGQVSEAMAGGIIARSNATAAIAVTGIAGTRRWQRAKACGHGFYSLASARARCMLGALSISR